MKVICGKMPRLWFTFCPICSSSNATGDVGKYRVDIASGVEVLDVLTAIIEQFNKRLSGQDTSMLILCNNDGSRLENDELVNVEMFDSSRESPLILKYTPQQGKKHHLFFIHSSSPCIVVFFLLFVLYYHVDNHVYLLLSFSSGSLPTPPTKVSSESPSKKVIFAAIQQVEKNLTKKITKQNIKIDGISNRLSSGLQGPRTRSQWVKDLKSKDMLTFDINFFQTFDESVESSPDLLRLISGEKIANIDFSIRVGEEPRKVKNQIIIGSREHFGNVVQQVILLTGRRHDCDARNKPSVGSHKPDYLLRITVCAGEQSIVVVGEIKGMADLDREFSDEEVGQILDFIQELLIKQGWRKFALGFLTDGVRFEFFRGTRRESKIEFTRSGLISEGAGWTRLSQLLQQSNEVLGFKPTTVDGWRIGDWLGSGATSSAFAATSEDGIIASAVCKIFCGDEEEAVQRRQNELRALNLMRENEWTPKVASEILTTAGDHAMPVLLVTPRGEKLGINGVRLPISAFATLVGTLETSHSLNLCHNDICPENMFAVEDEESDSYFVLLNDWGSSMTFEEVAAAEKFCTHEQYYNVGNMGAAEDLAALVRSVFVLTQCTFSPVETVEELDSHMHLQWSWGDALDAALALDYKAVERFLLTGNVADVDTALSALTISSSS